MPVRLTPEAREEPEDTVSFYSTVRRELGRSFLNEFQATVKRLRQFPAAARKISVDVRRRSIHKFPHYVLYRVTEDEIEILAVCHRRRSPTYRRIEESAESHIYDNGIEWTPPSHWLGPL
jgi:plasmid stabilization system protein ParE